MTKPELEFTLISGLSGAGKSLAMRCFEDFGYFCIDNLPPALIGDMIKLGLMPDSKISKIAVVTDARGGEYFDQVTDAISRLRALHVPYKILFLEASDNTLMNRFKETRRRHPLATGGDIAEAIRTERELLGSLRGSADMVLDTSVLSPADLRETLLESFLNKKTGLLMVTVNSFGFKYGVPPDADIVMDVRFLPNPHYIPELKNHTGMEDPVHAYVMKHEATKKFLIKFQDLLSDLLPAFVKEGKTHLTVAIGCTGGNHRSVAISREITEHIKSRGYQVTLRHRDMGKDIEWEPPKNKE